MILFETEICGNKYWASFPHLNRNHEVDFRRPHIEGLQNNAYSFNSMRDAEFILPTAQMATVHTFKIVKV